MKLVLDTNIVLDLFVFRDEAVRGLRHDLADGKIQWLASPPMRDELAAVLAYEHIGARLCAANVSAEQVLASDTRAFARPVSNLPIASAPLNS